MKYDEIDQRDARDDMLSQRSKPTLRPAGIGWYCMGKGTKILALTPKLAYDHWEFACCKGYRWEYEQARHQRDMLLRGSTGLHGGERG